MTSETFPDLDGAFYSYDSAGYLNRVFDGTSDYVSNVTYNARGQKKTITYGNGVTSTFSYFDQTTDILKNFMLKSRVTSGPGGSFQNLAYDYDDAGNMSSVTDSLFTASRTFGYDDLNRLTSASGTFGANQAQTSCSYGFDAIGNILNKCGVSYFYSDGTHPSFVTSTSDGRSYAADPNGNTLNGAGRTFSWSVDNRVASVTLNSSTTTMDYDYTGSRVKKFGPLGMTLYPFPGYEVAPDGTKTKFFRAGTEMLASKQTPVSGPDKKLFYHADHLGGINVITDTTGARVQLDEYDPWGKVSRSDGNVDAEHRFTGQKLDPESGLYYYGARYYDPDLARFVSPDTIVPAPGDPQSHNRYAYTRNNPVKYTDPTGHSFLGVLSTIFQSFKQLLPVINIIGGVMQIFSGNVFSSFASILNVAGSFIKNPQFQFASQIFGAFGGGGAGDSGGGSVSGSATEQPSPPGDEYAAADPTVVTDIGSEQLPRYYRPNPTVNQEGLEFIASFEKFRSNPYIDPTGNLTIGYGHRIFPGETFPQPITQTEAWDLLQRDVQTRVEPYLGRVEVALNQNQANAVGSFIFNVGGGYPKGFLGSTMFGLLNAGDYNGAAMQFGRWIYGSGQILPGLISRRQLEADLFAR